MELLFILSGWPYWARVLLVVVLIAAAYIIINTLVQINPKWKKIFNVILGVLVFILVVSMVIDLLNL